MTLISEVSIWFAAFIIGALVYAALVELATYAMKRHDRRRWLNRQKVTGRQALDVIAHNERVLNDVEDAYRNRFHRGR